MEVIKKFTILLRKDLPFTHTLLKKYYQILMRHHGKKIDDGGTDIHTEKYIIYSAKLEKLKRREDRK